MRIAVRGTILAAAAVVATYLLAAAPAAPATVSPVDPHLQEVLTRFDRAQESIRSLSAEFTWTTQSPLLKLPTVSNGKLRLTKPDSMRCDIVAPEPMAFVIAHGEYTGYFPKQKRAERRDSQRWSDRFFRVFGIGQNSSELGQFYDIALGTDPNAAGADVLVLTPKRKRARKLFEHMYLHIDRTTGLPLRVVTESEGGGRRDIAFRGVKVNVDIPTNVYTLNLPADVVVQEGMTGLGGTFGLAADEEPSVR